MSWEPPPPRAAYFDRTAEVWVLSRYVDVLAAFRDPHLWTIAISGKDQMEVRDDSGRLAARGTMQEALSHPKIAEWRGGFEADVAGVLAGLAGDRPVDLLRDFFQPCCLALAGRITGVPAEDVARLGEWSAAAFGGTGAAKGSEAHTRAARATEELNRYFADAAQRMGEPTFVGTAQTMARLLANGWLALLRHPQERERLRSQPELMPAAVEELLRYAGIVPTLYRRAYAGVEIGAAQIAEGQRVHLRIASANRDPEQFPDPDRLDVGRRAVNHLALGIGRNSCVGNLAIRMASWVTTTALLRTSVELAGDPEWKLTASFSWPASLPVMLGLPTPSS
jgi:cytochrome P450